MSDIVNRNGAPDDEDEPINIEQVQQVGPAMLALGEAEQRQQVVLNPVLREQQFKINRRLVEHDLAEAERMSTHGPEDLRPMYADRVNTLTTIIQEMDVLERRIMSDVVTSSDGNHPQGSIMAGADLVERQIAAMGEQAAISSLGAEMVALYREVGQNAAKFQEMIAHTSVLELEVINGVTAEALAEEIRPFWPTNPLSILRSIALQSLRYFTVLRYTGCSGLAIEASGIMRRYINTLIDVSDVYRIVYTDALEHSSDYLEDEARRRAVLGVAKPVFYQGDIVGHVQEYSDDLLKMLLRANRTSKYQNQKAIIQNNVNVNNTFNLDDINMSALREKLSMQIEGRIINPDKGQ